MKSVDNREPKEPRKCGVLFGAGSRCGLACFLVGRASGPDRVNNPDHFVGGGNKSDPVGLALTAFRLEVDLELIVVKHSHAYGIVETGAENGVASLGDAAAAVKGSAGLLGDRVSADEGDELFGMLESFNVLYLRDTSRGSEWSDSGN